jgi:hypothetical protein
VANSEESIDKTINEFVSHLASDSAISMGRRTQEQITDAENEARRLRSSQAVNDRRVLHSLILSVQDKVPVTGGINRSVCHIAYKSRSLDISIDWSGDKWSITGTDLVHRRFLRDISTIPLTDDGLETLALKIAEYFSGRYRTLQSKSDEEADGEKIDLDGFLNDVQL